MDRYLNRTHSGEKFEFDNFSEFRFMQNDKDVYDPIP